jgi:tetratricopeptide (TPR) repeat protein
MVEAPTHDEREQWRMHAKLVVTGVVAGAVLLVGSEATAQRSWVGVKVMPRKEASLKLDSGEEMGDWLWIGRVWVKSPQIVRIDHALDYYNGWLRREPDTAAAYNDRGIVWMERRQIDKAIDDFTEAIRLEPKEPEYYCNRGDMWCKKREYDKAIKDATDAAALDHRYATPYFVRGLAWAGKKEYDKAIADYAEAMRLDPQSSELYNRRAWLRATCPDARFRDGAKAVKDATLACELSNSTDPDCFGTLAAAYAEVGDFEKAIKWQNKKGEFTPPDQGDLDRLALYKEGKPFHE